MKWWVRLGCWVMRHSCLITPLQVRQSQLAPAPAAGVGPSSHRDQKAIAAGAVDLVLGTMSLRVADLAFHCAVTHVALALPLLLAASTQPAVVQALTATVEERVRARSVLLACRNPTSITS